MKAGVNVLLSLAKDKIEVVLRTDSVVDVGIGWYHQFCEFISIGSDILKYLI